MKKASLLLISFLSYTLSQAQITTSNASFPVAGDVQIINHDSLHIGITPSTNGTNQTWNYGSLMSHYKDTSYLVSVSSTPNGNKFPAANLAGKSGSNYAYFNKTATNFDLIGIAGNFNAIPFLAHYTQPDVQSKTNTTYNTNYNFNSAYSSTVDGSGITIPGVPVSPDSVRLTNTAVTYRKVTGWGTITNPLGTYACLKQKDSIVETTIIDAKFFIVGWQNFSTSTSISTSYDYIDNFNLSAIVHLGMDSTSNTVSSASFRQNNPPSLGFVAFNTANVFSIYPNPSNGNTISLLIGGLKEGNYVLQITDLMGRVVCKQSVAMENINIKPIALSNLKLAAGNYIATISNPTLSSHQSLQFEILK
jgi:Secretion system C-terminal sorting domain